MNQIGHHVLLEFFDCECDPQTLERESEGLRVFSFLRELFRVLNVSSHQFDPMGYSVLLLLAESHVSIHTWPQNKFCSLDLYTCSGGIPEQAIEYLIQNYKPSRVTRIDSERGVSIPNLQTKQLIFNWAVTVA